MRGGKREGVRGRRGREGGRGGREGVGVRGRGGGGELEGTLLFNGGVKLFNVVGENGGEERGKDFNTGGGEDGEVVGYEGGKKIEDFFSHIENDFRVYLEGGKKGS